MNGGVSLVSMSDDGMLPEAVVVDLQKCVKDRRFRFGVHYPSGGGYGNVVATMKVYASGTGLLDRDVVLAPGDLWDAGSITCGDSVAPTTVTEVPGPLVVHDFQP